MSGLRMSQGGLDDLIRAKANTARGAGADGLDIKLMYESGMDSYSRRIAVPFQWVVMTSG